MCEVVKRCRKSHTPKHVVENLDVKDIEEHYHMLAVANGLGTESVLQLVITAGRTFLCLADWT